MEKSTKLPQFVKQNSRAMYQVFFFPRKKHVCFTCQMIFLFNWVILRRIQVNLPGCTLFFFNSYRSITRSLGGGFSNIFYFHPLPGEDIQFYEHIFSNGLKPPTSIGLQNYTPGRLTWNLRIHPWKRKIIFQTIIFRFQLLIFGGAYHIYLLPQLPWCKSEHNPTLEKKRQ